jgi:hypothetical protein
MRHPTTRVRGGATALVMLFPSLILAVPLLAQEQASDTTRASAPSSAPSSAPYRSPQLALAAPAHGEGLPQDKPAIVLRYARGESDDPLDLTSLVVLVDGEDRSTQFHADSTEAWGSIDPLASGADAGQALALGVHQLTARICSLRSLCTDVREAITIEPSVLSVAPTPRLSSKSRVLTALVVLLTLIQRLFTF